MKEIHPSSILSPLPKIFVSLGLLLAAAASAIAQLNADAEPPARRIARARALSAAGHLPAARSELESLVREPGVDESVREIALVLLVGVYLDQADYMYAENALNEAFRKRTAQDESTTRAYFAVAGQSLNGVRAHVERYRTLGLDINDAELPAEAVGDLDRLRGLLEKVIAHGKSLRDENTKSMEASALLEDATALRARLARNDGERTQWQREVAEARQRIMGPERRVAGTKPGTTANNVAPSNPPAAVPTSTAANTPASTAAATTTAANNSTTPAPAQQQPATSTNSPAQTARNNPPPATTQTAPPANDANTNSATPAPSATPGQGSATNESAPAQPVEVGSLITKVVQKVDPAYPATAKSARVSGKVTVFLQLDEKGAVQSVKRTDGPEMLRRAAEDAARRWKFRPTLIGGQPVRVSGYVSFNFTL